MIEQTSATVCACTLIVAGVMELMRRERGHRMFWWSARLAAFGFIMLGMRYIYLIVNDDIARLHIIGTSGVTVIALSRVIACAQVFRGRL